MSIDQEYEAECLRAELLGLPKPDKESYAINKVSPSTLYSDEDDEEPHTIDNRYLEEISLGGENMKQTSGGLDELNSILAITQKKLNNFKTACGSFTNLLKVRIRGSGLNSMDPSPCPSPASVKKLSNPDALTHAVDSNGTESVSQKNIDFDVEISNQVDKLDSLLSKADNAVNSMSAQNKQMKKMLQ